MNKWCVIGNLTKEPELRTTQSGKSLCRFSIAVKSSYNKDAEPLYMNCQTWGQTAKYMSEYLHKGDTIEMVAALKPNNYVDKNNNQHRDIIADADEVKFVKSPKSREQSSASDNDAVFTGFGDVPNNDELPF